VLVLLSGEAPAAPRASNDTGQASCGGVNAPSVSPNRLPGPEIVSLVTVKGGVSRSRSLSPSYTTNPDVGRGHHLSTSYTPLPDDRRGLQEGKGGESEIPSEALGEGCGEDLLSPWDDALTELLDEDLVLEAQGLDP
jgi:hypothetical protein